MRREFSKKCAVCAPLRLRPRRAVAKRKRMPSAAGQNFALILPDLRTQVSFPRGMARAIPFFLYGPHLRELNQESRKIGKRTESGGQESKIFSGWKNAA